MSDSIFKGTVIIAAGGFISKVIGALYRVPLTNVIGAEGIGLYQTVFPVYCLLLTLSSTGLPTALSKLIASDGKPNGHLRRSVFFFGLVGIVGSALMCVLGGVLAKLQGSPQAARCYIALSPSVALVSVLSCFRGYFQGLGDMKPTAISQIIEQIVKATFGLLVCGLVPGGVEVKAAFACLAVTVAECFALLYVALISRKKIKSNHQSVDDVRLKRIISFVLPVAASSVILPLGNVADSFIIVNTLSLYRADATAVYGIYSGSVQAIIGVPVALAYGVAVALVPVVARGRAEHQIANSLRFTGVIAIPCWLFLTFFSPQCIRLIYGGFSVMERIIAEKVLMLEAITVLLISLLQTANAVLIATSRQGVAVKSMAIGLCVRVMLCLLLTKIPAVGVLGAVIAACVSYLVSLSINFRHILKRQWVSSVAADFARCLILAIICVLGGYLLYNDSYGKIAFVIFAFFIFAVYALGAYLLTVKRLLAQK